MENLEKEPNTINTDFGLLAGCFGFKSYDLKSIK